MRSPALLPWAATAGVVGLLAVLQLQPSSNVVQGVSDGVQLALAVAAAAACARAARGEAGSGRWVWVGLTASITVWALGQVRFMMKGPYAPPDPVMSGLFLGVALPLVPALVLQPDRPDRSQRRLALDVAITAVLVAFVYLYFGVSFPDTSDPAAYYRWRVMAGWVQAVVVVGAFAMRLRTAVPPWRDTYRRLFAACLLWFVGDAILTVLIVREEYRAGLLDLPWTVPFVWVAFTAWRWRPSPVPTRAEWTAHWSGTRRGAVLALLAVGTPPLLHFLATLAAPADVGPWRARVSITAVALVLLAGLFLVRQLATLTVLERAEQERLERRRLSEERFSKAFRALPVGAAITTLEEARFLDVNDRLADLVGFRRDHMVGRTAFDLGLWVDPAVRGALVREASGDGGLVRARPVQLRHHSGEVLDVLVSIQPVDMDEVPCLLSVFEDQRERERLEQQIVQSQKMEAVGELAGRVAHDLNNLLTAVLAATDLARMRVESTSEVRGDLEGVLEAAERAAALTGRLPSYGRAAADTPGVVDVTAALRAGLRTVRRLVGDRIVVEADPAGEPLRVSLSDVQFDRILVNLVVNARDAMPDGGRLRIAAGAVHVDDARAARQGIAPGPYVALGVTDTGGGMSDEVRRRMFEPFFTTKAPGRGSGLGLATVLDLARLAGGTVGVDSALNRGTTVEVLLPEATDGWQPPEPRPPEPAPTPGIETILLVEDEEAVRHLSQVVLERQGYRVLSASGGEEALALAQAWDGRIDLLLTDVVMPGMNGPQLARQLLLARPGTRVLFASGYTADALGPRGVFDSDVALIWKPFRPSELLEQVRQVLDRR
jgi:PAS domain S-box-containing protein